LSPLRKKKKKRIPIAKPPLDIFKTSIISQGQEKFKPRFERSRFASFFRFHKKTVPSKGQQRI
jgi:hypothetical protein